MKKTFAQQIKEDFNTTALVMIPLCVGINIVGQFFTQSLRLPLWLNIIGTIIAGVVAGPWVGFTTGILTNVVASFTIEGPTALAFALVNGVHGLVAGYLAGRGMYRTLPKAMLSGFIGKLCDIPIGAPIVVLMFGGITTGASSAFTAFMMATGTNIWQSVISTSLLIDGSDKVLSAALAFLIIKALPKRTLYRFSRAAFNVLGEKPEEQMEEPVPARA
jgi:energy-coupling factor transport system substrate-specific component